MPTCGTQKLVKTSQKLMEQKSKAIRLETVPAALGRNSNKIGLQELNQLP
jgi:hypothetical protein